VFDFGINDDGTFYYVMELLEGMDLRSLVEKTGAIPQARCVHFLRQACASLADAHGHGLVHRDVKPANLFTCRRGLEYDFVKVLDFGLVKETREQGDATQLTSEGVTTGTPAFMAPEMAIGDADVDARADLYALGCVGYWLLTGALVFDATSGVAMVVKHARETPIAPSRRTEAEIHPGLDSLILACLAKNRDDRPLGILELDRELGRLQAEIGPWSQERAERWWRTHLPELTALSQTPLQSALPDAPA
jgi:serine/threonine-protein kinase